MASTPKKSTEAEDVLEFLNSLPENSKKAGGTGAFRAKANKNGKDGNDNDILDFLDELEKSDIKTKKSDKKETKEDAPSEEVKQTSEEEPAKAELDEVEIVEKAEQEGEQEQEQEQDEDFVDPITSISNWWSSSGSQTVNSFWSNAVTITNRASEEATKFAQIEEIESRIKSLNLDDQAKKLIDSASKNVVGRDPLKILSANISNVLHSLNHADEVLTIYLIHDLINFKNLNDIILSDFKKVLKQVQGNINIKVIKQNTANTQTENFKKFNLFEGKLIDGEKLAFVNLESSVQSVKKAETEKPSDEEDKAGSNSKLFISILPIRQVSKLNEKEEKEDGSKEFETIDQNSSDSFSFTVILKDITHNINIISRSQSFPIKWIKWLEGGSEEKQEQKQEEEAKESEESDDGEVDPSEWVKEWIDDGLALTIGVLAQTYVVKRMGY